MSKPTEQEIEDAFKKKRNEHKYVPRCNECNRELIITKSIDRASGQPTENLKCPKWRIWTFWHDNYTRWYLGY